MRKSSITAWLDDILQEVSLLEEIAREADAPRFRSSIRLCHIAERSIEIISEASRHIPQEFKDSHTELPWASIASVGNVLRHEYHRIDPDIIWDIMTRRLVPLRSTVETLKATLAARDEGKK
jgi:uncharacterized protein with HEPN domain